MAHAKYPNQKHKYISVCVFAILQGITHKYVSLCISCLEFYWPFPAVIANAHSQMSNCIRFFFFFLQPFQWRYFICWLFLPVFSVHHISFSPTVFVETREGRERDHLLQELCCGTCEHDSLVVSFLRENFVLSKYCLSADYKWINYIVGHRCFCLCLGKAVGFHYCSIWMLVFFLEAFF